MRNNILLRTNAIVCSIITLGFIVTTVIGYQSNFTLLSQDTEHVSSLAADGIYYQLESVTSQPVDVSLTMANDSLLKNYLSQEDGRLSNTAYIAELQKYLNVYREKYSYDSVFLVSAATARYYHFNGLNRVLTEGDPENTWYYSFLESPDEYSLNIDNDQAAEDNRITIFVNCKIHNDTGDVIGVVGVGLKTDYLQELLREYDSLYQVNAALIDDSGIIQVSSSITGYEKNSFFEDTPFPERREQILSDYSDRLSFWYGDQDKDGYVVAKYVPSLKWHLVVENNTDAIKNQFYEQLARAVTVVALIILLVLFTITQVMRKYNAQLLALAAAPEIEYQRLLQKTTEGLYKNIFEFDITHNTLCGQETKQYFKQLGLTERCSYDDAIRYIAEHEIKSEYVSVYRSTFARDHVMESYHNGVTSLSCDFMACDTQKNSHWYRITARIFLWNSDQTIRLISYRSEIDDEKNREIKLIEQSRRDSLTGLYNKRTTEEMVEKALVECSAHRENCALLIFDIDNFKSVNDSMGHAFGDSVISDLADELDTQFHDDDIVGRIGGDEFAVLVRRFPDENALAEKMARFCSRLQRKNFGCEDHCTIACSIGSALFPIHGSSYADLFEKADQALYFAKGHGKATYSLYNENELSYHSSHMDHREVSALLERATDGIVKAVYLDGNFRLLYFNAKASKLFGTFSEFSAPKNFNMMERIHPEDYPAAMVVFQQSLATRTDFTLFFRIVQKDQSSILVKASGFFTGELYEGNAPVLYVAYSDLSSMK